MKKLENKSREGLENYLKDVGNLQKLDQDLENIINNRLAEHPPQKKKRSINQTILIASIVLLMAVIAYFIHDANTPRSNQELYAHYYQKYEFLDSQRRGDDKPYEEANLQKEQLSKALIELENNNHKRAKEYLTNLHNEDSIYDDVVSWYLALSYIKSDETAKAKKLLSRIVTNRQYNHQKAATLLKELNHQ